MRCLNCDLIFVPTSFHLALSEEKKLYDFHQNGLNDVDYQDFLQQLLNPLLGYLKPGMKGLDFGSGPGPTLHQLLEQAGFLMQIYDPFYANNPLLLEQQYDFVTATEVVEHFNAPDSGWRRLVSLIKPQGFLGIMTLLYDESTLNHFASWWYKNDRSHVVFYSWKTLAWLAEHFHLSLKYHTNRVAVFQKV